MVLASDLNNTKEWVVLIQILKYNRPTFVFLFEMNIAITLSHVRKINHLSKRSLHERVSLIILVSVTFSVN